MNRDELIDELLGSTSSFENALRKIRDVEDEGLLLRLLDGIDNHPQLDNAERERRFSTVFSRLSPPSAVLLALATAGATLNNAVLRNALTQILPPEFRSRVFRGRRAILPHLETEETARFSLAVQQGGPTAGEIVDDEPGPFSDVIILSLVDDPATKKLLESAAFVPLRCQSGTELDQMIADNQDICAFLVEQSFLSPLNQEEQTTLVVKLARFSTFTFLRFQENSLIATNAATAELIGRERCQTTPPTVAQLSFRESTGLQQRELVALRNARGRLRDGGPRGLFIPGELSDAEVHLLGTAMSQYAKRRRFNPGAELSQVRTKFLHGGQTNARVAIVRVDDLRVPVIVKLDGKDAILGEARRFLTFIHKDNPELNPEVHIHGNAALIVFGIVQSTDMEGDQPAPTLEQCVTSFWYDEMRDPVTCDEGASLQKGFSDAVRRLSNLNKQKCGATPFPCMANPYLTSVKEMERLGFDWGLGEAAIGRRNEAEELLASAHCAATCHGDAHSRNVLIRGEQGFLIDYAYSGPGHPCSDLIRLELSVYLTKFVQLVPESELTDLQRDFSIHRLTFDELLSNHEGALRSKTNRLCLSLCVVTRDRAAEVLDGHGLSWKHYLAVKLLTAWQSLPIPGLQHALARGIIRSIET